MNKKIILFKPNLGQPFKKTDNPGFNDETNLPPIRKHWQRFMKMLAEHLNEEGYHLTVIQGPLWKLEEEAHRVIDDRKPDAVLFPHRTASQLWSAKTQWYYFMQSVFPWIFTIDSQGWGGSHSLYPFNALAGQTNQPLWDAFQEYINENSSKFEQPESDKNTTTFPKNYVLFLCQLPHDETISMHSDVSVESALSNLLQWAFARDINVVVKGHPINPSSMQRLKTITAMHNHAMWVDNVSVHDTIKGATQVYTVNSGAGFESLLHQKPVVTFGKTEYDRCTFRMPDTSFESFDKAWNDNIFDYDKTCKLLDAFVNHYGYDSRDIESFKKLKI